MSKYKEGDKIVIEITGRFTNAYGHEYYSVLDSIYSTEFIDKKSEPLRDYTEPMKAKIRRQAAEITRLLAENKRLKKQAEEEYRLGANAEYEKWKEHSSRIRAEGQNEAWELARKCMLMTDRDRENIFGSGHNALYGVLTYFDYKHAAAKVEAWEKSKEEIKVGDIIKVDVNGLYAIVTHESDEFANVVHADGNVYLGRKDGMTKTGRHIDIDSFLKQIGGEE